MRQLYTSETAQIEGFNVDLDTNLSRRLPAITTINLLSMTFAFHYAELYRR